MGEVRAYDFLNFLIFSYSLSKIQTVTLGKEKEGHEINEKPVIVEYEGKFHGSLKTRTPIDFLWIVAPTRNQLNFFPVVHFEVNNQINCPFTDGN